MGECDINQAMVFSFSDVSLLDGELPSTAELHVNVALVTMMRQYVTLTLRNARY